ncbi:MAG: hypothetical protein LQ348_000637 [Seirophora lacunosa]|nr:MAG: hypothetical protein LQ348_000637 [Seirophora lacunosa]
MRISSKLPWVTSLLTATTLATDGRIYISGYPPGAFGQTLSPATTRLLLARRLGLSHFHSLEGADDTTLSILNGFGGEPTPLLHERRGGMLDQQTHLVIVEGVQNAEDMIQPYTHKVAFTLSDPPHSSYTSQLVKDFFRQAQHTPLDGQLPCSNSLENDLGISGGTFSSLKIPGQCFNGSPNITDWKSVLADAFLNRESRPAILHISLPESPTSEEAAAIRLLSKKLYYILEIGTVEFKSTVVLMPPSTRKTTKRSPTSPYGSYLMPDSKPLRAREVQSEEQPLKAAPSPTTTSSASNHHHSTPEALKASSAPSSKSPGILPVCQPSLEKLVDATNNCSGHGVPYLKHNSTSDSCFVCQCRKTIVSRGDGKGVKTIEWAGPACSKKDVSVPFWLLAGISIAMVATVSWGIGLLFSIGQEELPGVIGAGVAGPRAQK